jgi:hypothetical protein
MTGRPWDRTAVSGPAGNQSREHGIIRIRTVKTDAVIIPGSTVTIYRFGLAAGETVTLTWWNRPV